MTTSLIISTVLILAFGILRGWAVWWTRREYRRRQREVELYSQWACPRCEATYGSDVVFTLYADSSGEMQSANQPAAIVFCPHCRNVSLFAANGLPADDGIQFRHGDVLTSIGDDQWTLPLSEKHCAELLADHRQTHSGQW